MPSYQDVNWGYNNDAAPPTDNPFPLHALNEHLAKSGYQMKPRDPYNPFPIIQWEKKGANPITLAAPQYSADGYDELVYDLDDVRDMLAHLNSDGVDVGDGHELVARKRTAGA